MPARGGRGAFALAVILVVLAAVPAAAQEHPLGLEVNVGYGGEMTGSRWTPVEVALEPVRPVAATLQVEVRTEFGGMETTERAIEVAATSRSVYRFLTPPGQVTVRVVEEGAEPVSLRIPLQRPDESYQVGVLGGVPAQGPPLRDDPTGRTGSWVGVDPAWVALSSEALEPLAALVAPLAELEVLGEQPRRNLAAAVAHGLDLVVAAGGAQPDLAALGLPPGPGDGAWSLTAADVLDGGDPAEVAAAAAGTGRGRVAVTSALPGEGALGASPRLWSALTGPSSGGALPEWDLARAPHQFPRLLADEDAGVPAVPWLAGFLLAYIVVVGPVNSLVLARLRRRELAWVTVPVVTAVFTGAAFLGAVGGRPPLGVAARAVTWVDGIGTETAVVGVRNPTPGQREVTLPGDGWTLRTLGSTGAGATLGAGGAVSLDLAALQLGGVLGTRTTGDEPPLEVQAVAGASEVQVEIRNTSDEPLTDVRVRSATSSQRLGDLAPGAAETAVIDAERVRTVDPYRDLFDGLTTGPLQLAAAPSSLEALLRADLLDGNPGLVWAVATTPGGRTGARVDGRAAVEEGTLVAVGVTPELPPGGQVGPHAVHRALVGGADSSAYFPSPLALEAAGETVLRFRFPDGGRPARLHEDLARGPAVDLSVWDVPDRRWVPTGEAFGPDGADPARFLSPLGEVHVLAQPEPSTFDFSGRSVSGVAQEGRG